MLLVEDNPINREIAVGLLELLGYHVDSAEDGRQACTLTATHPYSVILMDCQMPVMDGFTATATIRERERQQQAARIPIIALTANAMEGDRDRCLAAGMDDYLTKPFSHQALANTLARWCLPQDQRQPNVQAEVGERDKNSAAATAQIDRTAWETIATFQRPGQPSVLHKIIGLYLPAHRPRSRNCDRPCKDRTTTPYEFWPTPSNRRAPPSAPIGWRPLPSNWKRPAGPSTVSKLKASSLSSRLHIKTPVSFCATNLNHHPRRLHETLNLYLFRQQPGFHP